MSISPFRFKFKKEKNKDKSFSNSNSSFSVTDSNNNSSSFDNNNFNQNFFNDSNNNDNIKDELNIDNKEFNTNTNTKYSSNINLKDSIIKSKKEKKEDNNYISKNSLYESKDISNIIEENNNNSSFYKFSIFKFLNNQFGFNNNNNSNNNCAINNSLNSNLLTNIQNFIIEKVSKPITNWIIKSNTIKILRKIGEGNSSDIFLGIYRGIEITEKRLHLNKEKNLTEFKREVSSFISLNHPYLLIFFGVIAEPKHLSIITEYCPGGNLHELLYKKKHIYLSWKIRKEFLLQIAIGMNYLHTNNPPILHRDLKSLNILLTNDIKKSNDITDIKIADLGLSVVNEKKNLSNERVGTCHWMAPEVINCQRYTTKSDVYSFGIIIWEVCTREMPYDSINNRETILYRVSVNRERPNIKRMPNDTPEKLKELMEQCLEHEPNKRPSFENIIKIIKEIDL
jgi:hypothetical protein